MKLLFTNDRASSLCDIGMEDVIKVGICNDTNSLVLYEVDSDGSALHLHNENIEDDIKDAHIYLGEYGTRSKWWLDLKRI